MTRDLIAYYDLPGSGSRDKGSRLPLPGASLQMQESARISHFPNRSCVKPEGAEVRLMKFPVGFHPRLDVACMGPKPLKERHIAGDASS